MSGSTRATRGQSTTCTRGDAKGGASIGGLFKALEGEAKAAGASQLHIIGHAIINPKIINPALAKRFGYEFRQINKDTVELVKNF